MNMLDRTRDQLAGVLARGRAKVAGARLDRVRARYFRELGEAAYAKSKGVVTSDAEIVRLVAEIDALEDLPSEEPSPDSDG